MVEQKTGISLVFSTPLIELPIRRHPLFVACGKIVSRETITIFLLLSFVASRWLHLRCCTSSIFSNQWRNHATHSRWKNLRYCTSPVPPYLDISSIVRFSRTGVHHSWDNHRQSPSKVGILAKTVATISNHIGEISHCRSMLLEIPLLPLPAFRFVRT